ncbi:MAG: hypothetical protein Q8P83_01935 [bacterium]|nr:hypothetical protein [bacterium]
MSLHDFIRRLQDKPYNVRVRILWTTTIIVAIVLIVIWLSTVKNEITNIDNNGFANLNEITDTDEPSGQTITEQNTYIAVERTELNETGAFQIFFKVNNSTQDILNFSPLEQIKLEINGASLTPLQINDRQDNPFVQKILSNTENFGTLVFSQLEVNTGRLIFDELYFEQNPNKIFRESLDLDFKKLNKTQELRK